MTALTEPVHFFRTHYERLRDQPPMKWMERLFLELADGKYPRLIDLPTGAGKTEVAVIWILALARHGLSRSRTRPVPRRLIWVVNRRVLVQQVFDIAKQLLARLTAEKTSELEAVRAGLHALSGSVETFFDVVQLRGQIVADHDWAIRPTVPQLIIGTVDQIGSRLLFQGYGLGKWGRPQQAALLGVDAWVAVDEAHLVPAFVLTLRQLHKHCALPAENLPAPFNAVSARLPFWSTELSATPGLPRPSTEQPFSLTDEEKADPAIADRILAASTRRVSVEWLPKAEKPKKANSVLIKKLVAAATASKAARIAVFVREVGVANEVVEGIKDAGVNEDRICKITGRIRGYERDRLSQQAAFKAFLSQRPERPAEADNERHFLVGTAAAEVGLDADADTIFCDFTSLPTLLQRLGRLDRRGVLSRRHEKENGERPTLWIFASREEAMPNVENQLSKLSTALKADATPWSAELMAGANWLAAVKAKDDKTADKAKEEKSAKDQTKPLIEAATWNVLDPREGVCSSPKDWLAQDFARIAAGPVVVPPVTDPVLDYWSATTDARSAHLSPHHFLYGLAEDDEGTPLVGVAFRLEVEALREGVTDEDDTEMPDTVANVLEIFNRFPPLRGELHQVKLSAVREWLASPEAERHPLVYRDRDKWRAKHAGEPTTAAAATLSPNITFILPASVLMREPCKKLLEDSEQSSGRHTAISDVLDGVSDKQRARYLRTIEPPPGRSGGDGAWLWDFQDKRETPSLATKPDGYRQTLRKELQIGGTAYVFRYYRPHQNSEQLQYLDNHEGVIGHIARAEDEAIRLAEAIAPGDSFLRTLLSTAAHYHDEGKRFLKWQRAFGRPKGKPEIAKLHPDLAKPSPLEGFRHEWESLRQLRQKNVAFPADIPAEAHGLWSDMLFHLVGVHHGHLRPSITDSGLTPNAEAGKHNLLRLEAAERFARLQRQLGRWRLAHLEALLKAADAEGSRVIPEEEDDGD